MDTRTNSIAGHSVSEFSILNSNTCPFPFVIIPIWQHRGHAFSGVCQIYRTLIVTEQGPKCVLLGFFGTNSKYSLPVACSKAFSCADLKTRIIGDEFPALRWGGKKTVGEIQGQRVWRLTPDLPPSKRLTECRFSRSSLLLCTISS